MDDTPKRGRGASSHIQRRAQVAEVCRRIALGERLEEILVAEDLPIEGTFHKWLSRSQELAAMYEGAKADRARLPLKALKTVGRLYSRELGREFCARLSEAEAIDDVCGQADMPCETTVYAWCREYPEFAEAYHKAREIQAHRLFDLAWRIARNARWDGWRGAKLAIDTIRWRIGLLAPETYGKKADEAGEEGKAPWVVEIVKFGDLPKEAVGAEASG